MARSYAGAIAIRRRRTSKTRCWPPTPYLGAGHEFMEKTPGSAPLLRHIHVQNPSGFVSFGLPIGDVPCMKRDIPVITGRISADLFNGSLDVLRPRMLGDVPPGFTDAIYRSAVR